MRKQTDVCLLCRVNAAAKTNSHIFPKFLSKKFLGAEKKGFQVSSSAPFGAPHKIVQDSPKEDYILCADCEGFLSVLEGIDCDTFTNWRYKCEKGHFSKKVIVADAASVVDCTSSDKRTVRLLLYSIFWRASVSSNALFNNIKMSEDFEEKLRRILLRYKSSKKNEYLELLDRNPTFELFPIAIITAEFFTCDTSNMLHVPVPAFSGVYKLLVDQFSFILFKSIDDIPVRFFRMYSNVDIDDCKIILFSQEHWQENITQPTFNELAEAIVENAKRAHLKK